MKRRNLFLFALAIHLFNTSNAQNKKETDLGEGTTIGLSLGVNFNGIIGKNSSGDNLRQDYKTGTHLRFAIDFPLSNRFYLQTGFIVSNKGSERTEFTAQLRNINSIISISYLEIPLNIIFKGNPQKGHFYFGAGPYIAHSIVGSVESSGAIDKTYLISFKNSVSTQDQTDKPDRIFYRPFDYGVSGLFGYQFKFRLACQFNAQYGLAEINPKYESNPIDKSSYKNLGFGFSLGYRFHSRH